MFDQYDFVCIACGTRCPNHKALCQHAKEERHRPYGCICGEAFARLDSLTRHISSKNGITKDSCPLCGKKFARTDHLNEHLKRRHQVTISRPFEDADANTHHYQGSTYPQPLSQYPHLVQASQETTDLSYLRQIHVDEAMNWLNSAPLNNIPFQQGLSNPFSTWMGNGPQQNEYSQMFSQDTQPNYMVQPDVIGFENLQAEEGSQGGGALHVNMVFQSDDDFNGVEEDLSREF
ncbi:hypothetical protein RRF57_012219 [Xylaria bambusicola]|uniref:C2H2-type domain-containing protein n=1 Tax=Xylaria bambusicola TaxID=326684 RepID=A0AAN7UUV3_9PEZI